ncbi:MAG: hypothetical protein VB032_06380 [Burkholderiaceae bacterium]|nr:hypothetical protein [Burkholderiaceae bacterium]
MNVRHVISALFVVALISACATSIDVSKIDDAKYQPVSPSQVEVITAQRNVTRPYKEIAILDAEEGGGESYGDMIKQLRERAGAMGAHAIIVTPSSTSRGGVFIGNNYVQGKYKTIHATAIRWN